MRCFRTRGGSIGFPVFLLAKNIPAGGIRALGTRCRRDGCGSVALAGEAGLTALQQVITVVGLPIFVLVSMMIPSLIIGLANEDIDHISIGTRPDLDCFEPDRSEEGSAS